VVSDVDEGGGGRVGVAGGGGSIASRQDRAGGIGTGASEPQGGGDRTWWENWGDGWLVGKCVEPVAQREVNQMLELQAGCVTCLSSQFGVEMGLHMLFRSSHIRWKEI